MKDLLAVGANCCKLPPLRSMQRYENLIGMNPASRVDVIEAYLAAADQSKSLIDHDDSPATVPWRRPYEDLEGGTFTSLDEVAKFINNWIKRYYEKVPPRQRAKV